MLILEAEQSTKVVEIAKKRFPKDYKEFCLKYPPLKTNLFDFIQFRLNHRPDEPYGNKDSALTYAPGFRRCHLIHGRAMIIYALNGNKLQLCAIVDHGDMDAKNSSSIIHYLDKLNPEDFVEAHDFGAPKAIEPQATNRLSLHQMDGVKTIMFELAASDPQVLRDALKGSYNGLAEYVVIGLDDHLPVDAMKEKLLNSFGEDNLKILIKSVLKSFSLSESRKLKNKLI